MSRFAFNALAVLAMVLLSGHAAAQTVYRCGNSYGQTPCPEATVIDAADPRTSEQKAQADAAAKRTAQSADALEKARLQREKMERAAQVAGANKKKVSAANTSDVKKKKTKKKEPPYFTARAPGEKKPAKKSSKKKTANQP